MRGSLSRSLDRWNVDPESGVVGQILAVGVDLALDPLDGIDVAYAPLAFSPNFKFQIGH